MGKPCLYCGTKEGGIHEWGCQMERCPFCGKTICTCNCKFERLGLKTGTILTKKQEAIWHKILRKEGRVPFIRYPNLCCYCGKLWPEMFSVPDAMWKQYVQPNKRGEMLCKECFDKIRDMIYNAKGGKS